MLATVLAFSASSYATTLTLLEEAFVRGPKLLVGDVADVTGDNAETLEAIELGSAPLPGQTRRINASIVTARMRSAGVDISRVSVNGSEQVRATTLSQEIAPQALTESLVAFIQQEMPWPEEAAEIDVPLPRDIIVVPEGDTEIRWRPTKHFDYLGQALFKGTVYVDGQLKDTVMMRAEVECFASVLVALRDIPRGHPISPNDVDERRMPLSQAGDDPMTRLDGAVGAVATKTIFPGQVLTGRNVAPPILVRRRQIVSVAVQSGGLNVQTQAKALSDARAGDVVLCENLGSRQQFQGVVRDDGVVVVQ